MKKHMLVVCSLFFLPATLVAQAKDETQERLQALEDRIKALEAEVQTLKVAQTAASVSVPETPAPAPSVRRRQRHSEGA